MNKKLFRQWLVIASIVLQFTPQISLATAMPIPRMWRVSSPGDTKSTAIYILAVSHPGARLEYDDYLGAKVIPAFLTADVLHFEDGGTLATNTQPDCAHALTDPAGIATLSRARAMVEKGAVEYFRELSKVVQLPPPSEQVLRENAASFTRGLSEFSVVQTLRAQYLYIEAHRPPLTSPAVPYPYTPIIDHLIRLKPGIKIKSMDESTDLAEAYCAAGERRADIISMYMAMYDIDHVADKPGTSGDAAAAKINEKLEGALTGKPVELDVYESALGCARTELWGDRFQKLLDGQVHFLALGAAHLFPSSGPVASCPGLLLDLRRRGFMVETIR